MSLTMGSAPFGHRPVGSFNFDPPKAVVLVEPLGRRVRGVKGGETVVDSDAVSLVHESRRLARYSFPRADVTIDAAADPHLDGNVVVPWDAVDSWFEEEDEVFVHPRDPYHRIDTLRTARRIRVSLNGEVLAESSNAIALYESGLPTRYYLPVDDVRRDLLERSDTLTQCAYKGEATHWSARVNGELLTDVAWSYDDNVRREAEDVRGRICFYNERTDLEIDGVAQPRPQSPYSR